MSSILLDTTVFSLRVPHPATHSLLRLYEADIEGHEINISFQTAAEALQGAELAGWGQRRTTALQRAIDGVMVLYPDEKMLKTWAIVRANTHHQGRRLGAADAWIAATALRWGLLLVTHDRDFTGLNTPGLRVLCRA